MNDFNSCSNVPVFAQFSNGYRNWCLNQNLSSDDSPFCWKDEKVFGKEKTIGSIDILLAWEEYWVQYLSSVDWASTRFLTTPR